MKSKLPLLLGFIAVITVAFFLRSERVDASEHTAANTTETPTSRAASLLTDRAEAAVAPTDEPTVSRPAVIDKVPPPPVMQPDLLAEVTSPELRSKIEALPPAVQREALRRLERLTIPEADLASLGVTGDGRFYYLNDIIPHDHAGHGHGSDSGESLAPDRDPGVAAIPPPIPTAAAAVPVATPPIRHSRPGSTNVLYLDFNGHTITGTSWNSGSGRQATYVGKAYDTDGDPSTFSDEEQADIIEIWERVAEDFSAFDVNITTAEPTVFTSTTGRGLITASVDAAGNNMPSSNAGGVAQLDVFGDSDYPTRGSPAFVYYDNFFGNEANIAEAVTHELGHNLGLTHDGLSSPAAEYYNGQGTGDLSWAPIMGVAYGKNVTQWSQGDYPNANNPQDDITAMQAKMGFATDEAGSTPATAAAATVTGSEISNAGIISSSADVDVYSFSTAAGSVTLAVNTFRVSTGPHGGNGDMKLELLDAAGSLVASHAPADSTNAALTYEATAGTYFIRLTPEGSAFYSSYGSAGQYTLTGTIIAAAPAVTSTAAASVAAGTEFSYAIVGTNGPTSYTATGLPSGLSVDTNTGVISGRATAIGEFAVPISATNSLGTGNATLTLTVTDAAPAIIAQTGGRVVVTPGLSTSLSITALSANGTPTYQWQRKGRDISGATGATLDLSSADATDSGYYWVSVTNPIGTTRSEVIYVLYAPTETAVFAWGDDTSGQATPPVDLDDAIAVTVGTTHALALRADGTVVAWGSSNQGELDVPSGLTDVVQIAAGDNVSFALKSDGTLAVWGRDNFTISSPPAGLDDVVTVACYGFHALALKADGSVVGWGTNGSGQLNIPADMGTVIAIAAGASTSYALNSAGTVFVWGFGPNGNTTPPPASLLWTSFAGGGFHAVGLKSDGTVEGFGFGPSADPPNGLASSVAVAAGREQSLALSSGIVTAWGDNDSGEGSVPSGLTGVFAIAAGPGLSLAIKEIPQQPAPAIMAQPTDQTVTAGNLASFSVTATGSPAPTFQWRKGGVDISGATTATLTIDPSTTADAGSYDVVVTNASDSITSDAVTLTIQTPPTISPQPISQTVAVGTSVAFTIEATGDPAPTYQWRKGGVNIGGATNASLGLSNVALADAADYDVVVTNAAGEVTSDIAALTVHVAPAVSAQPQSQTVLVGADVTLSVSTTGTPSPTFQWRKDGVTIAGATAAMLQLDGVTAESAGSYDVVVTNILDMVTSDAATLTVEFAPTFSTSPQTQTVDSGTLVVLSVAVTGVPFPTVQWRKDGEAIGGATGTSLDLGAVSPGANGGYDVVATNSVDETTSPAATLRVLFGPSVNIAPFSQTVDEGESVTFTVAASGDPLPTYQWRKGGVDIQGATSASYTIASAAIADAADYDVELTNSVTTVTTTVATLTVQAPPTISVQPQSQTVTAGTEVTLTVTASGTPVPTYQWNKVGSPIAGATGASLVLGAVELDDAADYTVDVINVVETVTSATATLKVQEVPTITTQPLSQTVYSGTSVSFTVEGTGSPSPSFQWRKDGQNINGATSSSLGLSSVDAADAGAYTVAVFNDLETVVSEVATLTIITVTGAHETNGYRLGETVTIDNTVTHAGPLTQLVWSVVPPDAVGGQDWSLSATAGAAADVSPTLGTTDLLEWTWNSVPSSPFTFSYSLVVPDAAAGDHNLTAMFESTSAAGNQQGMVSPDPLVLAEATTFHSADTDQDFTLSLSELLRVIELYNTRAGTSRTGRYTVDELTADGFTPDPTAGSTPSRFHSADTDRDGTLSLSELLRVIELYNTRSGTSRTGAYRIDAESTDGFAPDV